MTSPTTNIFLYFKCHYIDCIQNSGPNEAYQILPPLESLASVEETVVRDASVNRLRFEMCITNQEQFSTNSRQFLCQGFVIHFLAKMKILLLKK